MTKTGPSACTRTAEGTFLQFDPAVAVDRLQHTARCHNSQHERAAVTYKGQWHADQRETLRKREADMDMRRNLGKRG